jgi:hypothetical protein
MKPFICFCFLVMLAGCAPKPQPPTKEQIIKQQYKGLLRKLWVDLNPTDEKFLEIAIENEAKGGSTIEDLRFQQKDVDALIAKKLLRWDNDKTRYFITDLGRDVFNEGQSLKAAEANKPENLRDHRLLRDKQTRQKE